jgi:hypothetical protein
MRRLLDSILIAAGLFVPACIGQELLDEMNLKSSQLGGVRLLGVSIFSGYSSTAYPLAGFELNTSTGIGSLGGDMSYGASASLGWQRNRGKTDVSVMYTGTYGGMARYSGVDGYSQSLALSAVRMLTSRWTFGLSASGQDSTMAQYFFQPSSLSVIAQMPATFDDLAAAFAAGQYSNAQAASLLTGTPVMQAPGRSLLMGNRVLSYEGQANLGYAISSRLQLHFASFTAAGQTRLGGQDNIPQANYVMPRSLGGNGGVGISYSLTPRTQIGADLEANRTVNHFQGVYSSTASASLGRKMGIHWFLRIQGGGTYGVVTQQVYGTPRTSQMVGGGSLGYRAHSYTLVASYDRSANDTFGFAVGTITTMSGAWNWHLPGSRWSVSTSFGEQEMRNTGFASLSGWQATAGLTTNLNPHTTLTAQYVYLASAGTYAGTFNSLGIHSVRITLGWAPQSVQR